MVAGDAPAGRATARRARDLAERLPARERSHAGIVSMVLNGEPMQASLAAVREHAAAYPRDAVPLSFALGVYGLLGFGGFPDFVDRQVALLQSVAPAWGDDWWYLAAMGWAHVEAGQAEIGIPMLDRALELTPDNANAVHGRAHGYYEQGAAGEGEAFIGAWLPRYDRAAPLHGHLGWHQALFALQRGDVERAVSVYLANVSPNASQALPMFTMIDSAAFAMRCELYGHPLPADELRAVAAFAEQHFPKPGVPFVNVHQALTQAVAGRPGALAAWTSARGRGARPRAPSVRPSGCRRLSRGVGILGGSVPRCRQGPGRRAFGPASAGRQRCPTRCVHRPGHRGASPRRRRGRGGSTGSTTVDRTGPAHLDGGWLAGLPVRGT